MNKKKVLALMLTAVVSAGMVLSGCGSTDEKAKKDAQIINVKGYDFKTIDPDLVSDAESITSCENVYEGLMREEVKNGESTVAPGGAEKYEVSQDKLTYTFHLRKDAKWSDGKPITAAQYVYSWKRLADPKLGSEYMGLLSEINVKGAQDIIAASDAKKDEATLKALVDKLGVEAKDDYTFVVTLEKPTPFFVNALTFKGLVPVREDKVKELGDKFGADIKGMVYNGPFVISEYSKGSKIVYSKNDKYWNAKTVKLDKCNGTITEQEETLTKMFDSGELDVLGVSGDNLTKFKEKAKNGECNYIEAIDNGAYCGYYNVTRPILKNKKVRQALTLAINRKEFLDVVYKRFIESYGNVCSGIFCGDKDYRKTVQEPLKEFKGDPKKLMEDGLKEEHVKPSDVKLELLLGPKSDSREKTGNYLQKLYKDKFGINVEMVFTPDGPSYFKKRQNGEFDLCMGGWSADYNDVSSFFNVYLTNGGNNNGKYSNAQYDSLVKGALAEQDNSKRIDMYKNAEKLLVVDDPAIFPTYYPDIQSFEKKYVKNFVRPKFGGYYDLSHVYIEGKDK